MDTPAPTLQMDTLDEWIAATVALIRSTEQVILATVDADGCLAVSTRGFDAEDIPGALRGMANALELDADKKAAMEEATTAETQRAKHQEKLSAIADAVFKSRQSKAFCPACSREVSIADPPQSIAGSPSICSCGAFVMPEIQDNELRLRLLSTEEIAALPDDTRNSLLRARKLLAARRRAHS